MKNFNTEKTETLHLLFEKIVTTIKNRLLDSPKGSFVRIHNKGDIVLINFGDENINVFSFKDDDLVYDNSDGFAPYVYQVLSLTSDNCFDKNKNQKWNTMVENTLLKMQHNSESKHIDAALVI